MEQLTDAALKVGVNLTSAQRAQFQRYFQALESANAKFNLTGALGWERGGCPCRGDEFRGVAGAFR